MDEDPGRRKFLGQAVAVGGLLAAGSLALGCSGDENQEDENRKDENELVLNDFLAKVGDEEQVRITEGHVRVLKDDVRAMVMRVCDDLPVHGRGDWMKFLMVGGDHGNTFKLRNMPEKGGELRFGTLPSEDKMYFSKDSERSGYFASSFQGKTGNVDPLTVAVRFNDDPEKLVEWAYVRVGKIMRMWSDDWGHNSSVVRDGYLDKGEGYEMSTISNQDALNLTYQLLLAQRALLLNYISKHDVSK